MSVHEIEIGEEAMKAINKAVKNRSPVSELEQIGVSQRLINLLQKNGINTIHDLMFKSRGELLEMKNFGRKQLEVIFVALSKYHLVDE